MSEHVVPVSSAFDERRAPAYRHQPVGLLPALQSLLYVLVVALFLITFTVQPIRIPSESMEPTLLVGDFLLMDKQVVRGMGWGLLPQVEIGRGDVVVFHDPVDDPKVHLVKRIIGVPGDRIHLRGGVVYRNGAALKEKYTIYRQSARDGFRDDFPDLQTMDARVHPNWWIQLRQTVQQGEITVPAQSYFVMGDNRNNSEDSRYWGFVPRDAIVGKPLVIYFSRPDSAGRNSTEKDGSESTDKTRLSRWDRTFHLVR